MKNLPVTLRALATLALFVAPACRDESADFDPPPPDAGPAFADARVIDRVDSGPTEPEYPVPTLTGVTPSSGPETGGTRVVLKGTGFVDVEGQPVRVFFGSATATGAVVLDGVSIAATTPPGAIGSVEVKVVTPGGEAVLPDGFRYHRDLRVLSVTPARIPEEGGVQIAIEGKGFDEDTVILIGRRPLAGQRLVSAEKIEGWAPALMPGRPEIHAFTREAEDRRSDLLVVFATPEITAIAPGYGPLTGSDQSASGSGFEGVERVRVGANPARFEIRSRDRVDFTTGTFPREGAYDVAFESRDASDTLEGGFIAYDALRIAREILGVTPRRVSSRGGVVVAIVGYGFGADAEVTIGGRAAMVRAVDLPHALLAIVPSGLTDGPKDVTLTTSGVTLTKANAIEVYSEIEVRSISPDRGPVAGGTSVRIRGTGFAPGMVVKIGSVALAGVAVTSPTEITGLTVAGASGPQDVVVENADTRSVLEDGFFFEEPFEVIRIHPTEGSIAGNTFVSVLGRGFAGTASVTFGGAGGLVPTVENGSVISTRTQPAASGPVDVEIVVTSGEASIPEGYRFYDPRLLLGGVWGGPIQGSVNVGVLDPNSGQPIPGMLVQLGYDADLRYAAVTDENGLATVSGPDVNGPQTITAGATGVEFVTYTEVNARNVTMFAAPYPQSMPPDAPLSPCPMGAQAPVVRGKVFRFKSSLDPLTSPGWLPVARVTYSQPNLFRANPPEPAEQEDIVLQDGESYEIVVMREGTVAVYAILGDFNQETQEFIPRKMGIVRSVPAAIGQVTEGVNISLDIELNREVDLRFDDPPVQVPGPSLNAVFPYLNLGSDGVISFPPAIVPDNTTVTIEALPNIAGADFFYLAGAFTLNAQTGGIGAPYSVTLAQSDDDSSDGLDVGPFLKMPEDVTPKPGHIAVDGVLAWRQPGIQPDLTNIFVVDGTAVSGCCCLDLNENGQCESQEPPQCGAAPVQFNRWTIYGPGGLQSYAMPKMVPVVKAFDSPRIYDWFTETALSPRFNYTEWTATQFFPQFWKSWTVSGAQFLSKEETD
jgi:hypothetical protein